MLRISRNLKPFPKFERPVEKFERPFLVKKLLKILKKIGRGNRPVKKCITVLRTQGFRV